MAHHFAFVVPPAFGHVNPTLPLVEELLARGHRVTYATGRTTMPGVVRAGATPLEMPWDMDMNPGANEPITMETLAGMLNALFDQVAPTFPALRDHFRADPVDAVCFDPMAYVGPSLADRLGVPAVALSASMAINDKFDATKLFLPPDFRPDHPLLTALQAKTDAFVAEHGIEVPVAVLGGPPAPLTLVFIPRDFQLQEEVFDDTYLFAGPSLGSRENEGGWEPPTDGSPVLFISLGTHFNDRPDFYAACAEAFADTPWHVVMSTGRCEVGDLPANFEARPSFPQLSVLKHAKVFVSHTGMNSTMESLRFGVPLVSVPQMGEQAANGLRAQELGLGRQLDPRTLTAADLRKTVEEVAADPAIREAVTRYGERLRAVDGAALSADALIKLVS